MGTIIIHDEHNQSVVISPESAIIQSMKKNYLEGMIKRHPDGFGFFIPDNTEHPDVYIPRNSMENVMTSDRVRIEVFPERGGERYRGEVLKILSRGVKTVVGTFHPLNSSTGIVRDDGKGWGEDIKIAMNDSKGAKDNELVSVEITSYPTDPQGFRGRVREVIGNSLDPLTDVKRVLFQNNIPHEFPSDVEEEARRFTTDVSERDMKGREDLRHLKFITIDGATARDFDDAIYVEQHEHGFTLYVAIADVSHYVQTGTPIDKEAYERGTSVYFPNFVVPMLPEVLSNGLCSLNPHVPRLALVAEMEMNFMGEVEHSDFYEAVIESKARVTYGEAQEIIEEGKVEKLKHVRDEILLAANLAKILMAKRFREGSLDLEIPETQIVLDSAGIPVDFIRSERLFAHRLIEEMMLAANVAVAEFLSGKDIPAIYRIHEPPNEDAIEMLNQYLSNFGSRVSLEQGKLQKRLTRALQEFEGKPESQVLNILALRSMSQAKYSSDNVGHFGLGFEFYTHFTSPIRRYPDLIVHRLIKSQVLKQSNYKLIAEEDLQTAANMLSACEQRSVKAERQFQAIKKARFMQKYIGEEFEGIISSVTKFGVFVLLRKFEVDGLIRSENLSREKLEFDEENLVLVGVKTGIRFAIGDAVTIQVAAADTEAGQVDFQLAGEAGAFEDLAYRPGRRAERKAQSQRDQERSAGRKGRGARGKEESPRRGRDEGSRLGRDEGPRRGGKPAREEKVASRRDREEKRPQAVAKPSRPAEKFQKSRKARAMDNAEDKVVQFLSEANAESATRGEKFDPEKHLQQALKKWRDRMGVESSRDARGEEEKAGPAPVKIGFRSKYADKRESSGKRGDRSDRGGRNSDRGGSSSGSASGRSGAGKKSKGRSGPGKRK